MVQLQMEFPFIVRGHLTGTYEYLAIMRNQLHGGRIMRIEVEKEYDNRWIAEIPDLSGVMVYGESRTEAICKVKALALRVIADRLEHGEAIPDLGDIFAEAS
jgi:predicted RNase H-like HicB family nuclease